MDPTLAQSARELLGSLLPSDDAPGEAGSSTAAGSDTLEFAPPDIEPDVAQGPRPAPAAGQAGSSPGSGPSEGDPPGGVGAAPDPSLGASRREDRAAAGPPAGAEDAALGPVAALQAPALDVWKPIADELGQRLRRGDCAALVRFTDAESDRVLRGRGPQALLDALLAAQQSCVSREGYPRFADEQRAEAERALERFRAAVSTDTPLRRVRP